MKTTTDTAEETTHRYPYRWTIENAKFRKDRGKVFSCFACGGGSTMGYKLAGYDVIGCNEIDPRMAELYVANHRPRLSFVEPIQTFRIRDDLPEELYRLDILDGSPPCSTFSMSGQRERAWGRKKRFREGQAEQVLDTLFFDFISLAGRLRPKVVIAENVKGMLVGPAMDYVRRIHEAFDREGYYCQHFLLQAERMGVPQHRDRVFFVCLRKDLAGPFLVPDGLFSQVPAIGMDFDEPPIPFGEVADWSGRELSRGRLRDYFNARRHGDASMKQASRRLNGKESNFNQTYAYLDRVCPTLTASKAECIVHFERPQILGRSEVCAVSSFPQDYDFGRQSPHYVCGMSVPPVMMANVAERVWVHWLSRLQGRPIRTSDKDSSYERKQKQHDG